jgi:hypothetical protein
VRFYVAAQHQLLVVMTIGIMGLTALLVLLFTVFARRERPGISDGGRDGDGTELICRMCKAKAVRPSFRSGLMDFLFSLTGHVPYRCEVCYNRFYVRQADAPRTSAATSAE